jgi:hypothetical protein
MTQRPRLPGSSACSAVPKPVRVDEQQRIAELEAEFRGFQVWTDTRPRDDGDHHWHARKPGWTPLQIISAADADDLRAKLAGRQA